MYKVMIVDDMEIFRRTLKRFHVWNNTFVITEEATDGLDALKKLEVNQVDLILVDIKMPRMGGIEFLQIVTERKLCPCVVLLSDYTEYSYARQGIVYGAFDYIGKSITETELKQLLDRAEKYLDSKKKEEQKLVELQEIVDGAYSAAIDVKYIAQCICRGEIKAVTLMTEAADTIEEIFCNDLNKALFIVKNTLQEIINETFRYYQWLPLYFNSKLFHDINLINCKDWFMIQRAIIQLVEELISIINRFMPCRDNTNMKEICEYLLMNVHEKLSVKIISEKMYISKAHLSEIFKQKVGITLLEYITMSKMERAKILLAEKDWQNCDIAYQLSFRDYGYFNKVFNKYTGLSITIYRQQQIRGR